jgi:thioredoxin-dependent peroxiredoxin
VGRRQPRARLSPLVYLEGMIQPGDQAPDFTARDQEGREVSLAKLRGRTVVLWFFPKADTPG